MKKVILKQNKEIACICIEFHNYSESQIKLFHRKGKVEDGMDIVAGVAGFGLLEKLLR